MGPQVGQTCHRRPSSIGGVTTSTDRRVPAAGIVGCLMLLAIGWSGLLVPSLIRSIEATFAQNDAGIGLFYLLYSVCYAIASFGGGPVTERVGRRRVLVGAALIHGAGFVGFGLAPSWAAFLVLAVPAGLGAGALDGGSNGLFLDLFRSGRGRAMNLLHLFFSIGALSAPLVAGALVDAGVPWQSVMIGTGLGLIPVAVALAAVGMPSGRHASTGESGTETSSSRPMSRLALPLLLLALAILTYAASEVGVSNWLVRYLDPAPLSTATLALSLFWAGLAAGRLVSSRISDRFDHVRFTVACALLSAGSLAGAIIVPSLPITIGLFAVCGFASGPIFPMIVAVGGERYPDRSAAVSGFLVGCAVVGGTIYPP